MSAPALSWAGAASRAVGRSSGSGAGEGPIMRHYRAGAVAGAMPEGEIGATPAWRLRPRLLPVARAVPWARIRASPGPAAATGRGEGRIGPRTRPHRCPTGGRVPGWSAPCPSLHGVCRPRGFAGRRMAHARDSEVARPAQRSGLNSRGWCPPGGPGTAGAHTPASPHRYFAPSF
jgi:hypothetical protein